MSRFREEIGEQPKVISTLLDESREAVEAIGHRIREAAPWGFVIAARGSSDHAALYAKYLFGARNRALVALAAPSLFTSYRLTPRLEGQCVIGISQSGASPDVTAVIEEARRQGALTIAITNELNRSWLRLPNCCWPWESDRRGAFRPRKRTQPALSLALLSP